MRDPKDKGYEDDEVRSSTVKTEVRSGISEVEGDLLDSAQRFDPALVVIQGENMGHVYKIPLGIAVMGRHPNCELSLQQRTVSNRHVEFQNDGVKVILKDLGSVNGTVVNRLRVAKPMVLTPNDLIKIGGYVFKFVDRSLDSQMAEYLMAKSSVDGLTGAYNKEHILKALASSMDIAKGGYPLSLIVIDLDHFKNTNDTYGHVAGDFVLKEACKIIRESALRREDILGRFGGEEFIVILPDTNGANALSVAERIRVSLHMHHFNYDEKRIPVTASLGVSEWTPRFKTADSYLERVDQLLYQSKQNGRNRVTSG